MGTKTVENSNGDKQNGLQISDTAAIAAAATTIIPSQLIFSSIITTQPKQIPLSVAQTSWSGAADIRTKTTATTAAPTSSSSSSATAATSCGDINTSSSVIIQTNDSKSTSNKQCDPNQATTTTIPSKNGPQAVTARLMDMGKKLLEAAKDGHKDHVRQLVESSGAPFTSDWLGTTALHLAAQNGHTEIAEILLRGGVNRDARTKLERTALHLAAQGGWLEVVDLLLSQGSDVNARDMLKMTPLHWAVERGHVRVVERLLLAGADPTLKSKFQLTPIDIAQNSQFYDVVELFRSWTNKANDDRDDDEYTDQDLDATYARSFNGNYTESSDLLDFDYHLALVDNASTSHNSVLDIDEPCIDFVELEWDKLDLEPDFFLSNDSEEEPKVGVLMRIVEELQKENKQLRQRVEQLSTTSQ